MLGSYNKYDEVQQTTITGLENSDISNNSMYSVFITASSLKDGAYVEGVGPVILASANCWFEHRQTCANWWCCCYYLGFAAYHQTITVGKDIF